MQLDHLEMPVAVSVARERCIWRPSWYVLKINQRTIMQNTLYKDLKINLLSMNEVSMRAELMPFTLTIIRSPIGYSSP